MDFGNTLRILIEDRDKSQKEVANDLNIAPTTLGNYVRNLREPDFETLVAIANYFEVSTDYLLNHKNRNGLSPQEERLLHLFSKLPEEQKEIFFEIGKILNKKRKLLIRE